MLEIVRCCSSCFHDTFFDVRIASGNALVVCGLGNELRILLKIHEDSIPRR